MANTTTLWDPQVWTFLVTLGIIFTALIVANMLRRLIKPLARTLIPSSVIAGFLLLLAAFTYRTCTGEPLFNAVTLEALTYHGLGLGVVAMTLRSSEKVRGRERRRDVFNSGVLTVSGYLLQAVLGIGITLGLSYLIGSWPSSGMLLPMGYGQGPGQAFNWGNTFEHFVGLDKVPFVNGTTFGLAVAAMGFISASVGGVIYLAILRRKGRAGAVTGEDTAEDISAQMVSTKEDVPLSESIDKLTIQFGMVFLTYLLAYGLMYGISYLCDISGVELLVDTLKPLIWGFNFLFAMLVAIGVKSLLKGLKKKGAIKRNYLNDFMLTRVSGLMFDLMVTASIAIISLEAFRHREFILPLVTVCVVGAVATYFWVKFVCEKLFPSYAAEQFLAFFGMLTGTVSTGIILLREIDPQYKQPAADNLIYQNLWAVVFGFPMLLIMGFITGDQTNALIIFGVLFALLTAISIVLFRKTIFKSKKKG